MQPARSGFTLHKTIGLIVVCAVIIALLLTPGAPLTVAIGIVLPGFVIDRVRGRTGIVGGTISASFVWIGVGIAVYTYSSLRPDPALADYLGPPPLTLLLLGAAGVVWGALAGTLLDVSISVAKSY